MTEGTNYPQAPAWLNLNAVCPPEVREELGRLTEKAEAMYRELDFLARLSFLTLRQADAVEPERVEIVDTFDPFGHEVKHLEVPFDLFAYVSGKDRLRHAMYRIAVLAMAGADDPENGRVPEWWATREGHRPDGTVISLPKWEDWHPGLPVDGEEDEPAA